MLEKLAKGMTSHFIRKNTIKEEERAVYNYCFEIMLSTLLNLAALVIIGVATARYIETLVFSVVFMLLRGAGGGAHANTHFWCICSLLFIFGIMIGLTYLADEITSIMSIPLMSVAMIISVVLAPVDCDNKRIDADEGKQLKKKLMFILAALAIIYIVFMIFPVTRIFGFSLAYAAFSVSMMFAIGAIKNKILRKKEKEQAMQ